ncbi:MAG: cyclic nucleotide-binding domain-containing protein [Anaerolineae bacterium]|nr:cyclic nucleotide-binding domain-containing protein [Anaerolineae bacterium]
MENYRQLAAFQDIPADELQWLIEHSIEASIEPGENFFTEGEVADCFYVTLEGEMQIARMVNGQNQVLGTTPAGIIGGELTLLNHFPVSMVTSQAIVPSRLMVFDKQTFRQIFASCPNFGAYIFKIATERMQTVAASMHQQEKMAALGKLSAGLAHELNNPAAAARRAAQTMRDLLPTLQAHTVQMSALGLVGEGLADLDACQKQWIAQAATAPSLSALEQSDREDELGDWLEEHGIANGWEMAEVFVSSGVKLDELDELAGCLPPHFLDPVITWLHDSLCAANLLDEVEQSTRRISDLVCAIKEYTYMDRAPVQDVDIHHGLDITLKVLKHKLRNVRVTRQYDPDLPILTGKGGELNQVWTNLIDNAVDAMGGQGELKLITRCENNFAMVEVTDNGPGIPPEVEPHIFEPFYTTKEVGSGTGLGLDIVYRIIRNHRGKIEVWSKPGDTRFIVRLPINGSEAL